MRDIKLVEFSKLTPTTSRVCPCDLLIPIANVNCLWELYVFELERGIWDPVAEPVNPTAVKNVTTDICDS